MRRRIGALIPGLAVLVVFLLSFAPVVVAQDKPTSDSVKPSVHEKAKVLKSGTRIEVKLTDKQKLKGKLGAVSEDNFEMMVETPSGHETRTVDFDDVKSLKPIMTTRGKWIMAGVITGAALGTMVAVGSQVD